MCVTEGFFLNHHLMGIFYIDIHVLWLKKKKDKCIAKMVGIQVYSA